MIQVRQYNIKSFDEFTEAEQEKILEKHRYINIDWIDNYTDYDEGLINPIVEAGFINPKVYYSLSYCQGDGACFECDEIDWSKALKDYKCKHKNWIIKILEWYCTGRVKANSWGCHYEHSRSRYFTLDNNISYSYDRIEHILSDVGNYLEHKRLELSEQLTSDLYELQEHLTSDEQIIETFEANEYLFNEYDYRIEG